MVPLAPSRRRLAGFAVLGAWLLGVLILPALHLSFHEVPHDHVGGAIHFHGTARTDAARHVHPHRSEDAAALRRASGPAMRAPTGSGLDVRGAGPGGTHDTSGLAHFGSAPGEGGTCATTLDGTSPPSPRCDVPSRFAAFFLESKRAPRPPPAA